MNKITTGTFILALTVLTMAPSQLKAQEPAVVHYDKEFYVTGEIIWYKLYLPQTFAGENRVIEVLVADAQGDLIDQHFLRTLGEEYVTGYYKIPYDAPSGIYQILFNAIHDTYGRNAKLARVVTSIYNDFETVRNELSPAIVLPSSQPVEEQLQVSVVMNESGGMSGIETGTVKITDAQGNPVNAEFSVSVCDAELTNPGVIAAGESISANEVGVLTESLVVKGRLYDKQGEPLQINVLGAYQSEVEEVVYSKSQDDGFFAVKMPDFSGERHIQFLGYVMEVEAFDVELATDFEIDPISEPLVYTAEIIDYLDLSRKRKKIYQYFTMLEQNLEPVEIPETKQQIKPDFRFDMEEYESFDNLAAFFGELITALTFEIEDSVYVAELQNPKGRIKQFTHLAGAPLFIIDGRATRNADFVARMEMSLVQYVDLYYDPYKLRRYWNAIARSGVVWITTKLPDGAFPEEEKNDIISVNGFLPHAEFPTPSSDPGVPSIRPQLYWNPYVNSDKQGIAQFQFKQSDDQGAYRVQVVAKDDQGRYGSAIVEYQVEQ